MEHRWEVWKYHLCGSYGLEIKACALSTSSNWSILIKDRLWGSCLSPSARCFSSEFVCEFWHKTPRAKLLPSFPEEMVSGNRELYTGKLTSPLITHLLSVTKFARPAATHASIVERCFPWCWFHRGVLAVVGQLHAGLCGTTGNMTCLCYIWSLKLILMETQLLNKCFWSLGACGRDVTNTEGSFLALFSYLTILMVWCLQIAEMVPVSLTNMVTGKINLLPACISLWREPNVWSGCTVLLQQTINPVNRPKIFAGYQRKYLGQETAD